MSDKINIANLHKYIKGVISNHPNYDGFSSVKNSRVDLLWPCIMYYVEIKVDTSELDIFERTVLKLADCKMTKSEDIADAMNMETETIAFIQNRLAIRGYVEDRIHTITDKGTDYLEKAQNGELFETEVVCLFRDLNSGAFLPYVEIDPAKNTVDGIYREENEITTKFMLPGNEKKKGCIVVPHEDFIQYTNDEPKSYLMLRAVKEYNSACSHEEIKISPISNAVTVQSKEIVLVHTVGFTTTTGDVYSTDAAGIGISDLFTDFIRQADDKKYPWINKILEQGKTKTEEDDTAKDSAKPKFGFPNISNLMYYSVKNVKELKSIEGKGAAERDEQKYLGEKIFYDSFTALEYALQLYYSEFNAPADEDIQIQLADKEVRNLNQKRIKEAEIEDGILLFSQLADNLGFSVPNNHLSLLKVYPGKIKAMRDGREPELIPLLCLCLAYANHDTEASICFLAKDNPNFISDILSLKVLRDNTTMAHGPGVTFNDVSKKKCEEVIEKVQYFIQFLNPCIESDFQLMKKNSKDALSGSSYRYYSYVQKMYDAKLEVYKTFGYATVNRLPTKLVKQLIRYVITLHEKKYIASSACAVLQQFFNYAILSMLKHTTPPDKNQRNTEAALKKCKPLGFILDNNAFPVTIGTVNYKKINKAVCGGNADTLGAAIIGFLLLVPDEQLGDIAKQHPKFITDLDFLLKSRGHSDVKKYSEQEVSTYDHIVTYILKELIHYID